MTSSAARQLLGSRMAAIAGAAVRTIDADDSASFSPRTVSRILLVDSDRTIHLLLKDHLESRKYVVDCALSPGDALGRIQAFEPDVVLVDVPTSSPYHLELLRVIRAQHLDMAVIVTSGDRSEDLAIEALRAGADDYLRKPYHVFELETQLARVVSRLAVMRQNAARHHQIGNQLARAAQLQAELLPRQFPPIPGFDVAASCLPAQGVGGDFYDWQQVSPSVMKLTVGDVMGKGMPAALLMTAARTVLRTLPPETEPLVAIQRMAATLDDDLARSGAFVTLFHARLDASTGRLDYVDAGHGFAVVRRADGSAELLRSSGLPLGIFAEEKYESGSITLDPDDVLVLYTDGLKDARPDLWQSPESMAAQIHGGSTASEIVDRLIEEARAWAPVSNAVDDITVVALRRASAPAASRS